MTSARENLLKIFRHEMPEWIPVAGHVDPYNRPSRNGMDPELAEALGEIQWGDEAIVTFSRYMGLDIVDLCEAPVRITRRNVSIEQHVDGDVTTNIWHTPKGNLREVTQVCRDGRRRVQQLDGALGQGTSGHTSLCRDLRGRGYRTGYRWDRTHPSPWTTHRGRRFTDGCNGWHPTRNDVSCLFRSCHAGLLVG